ncbi:HdeD family acid-resistance protein [Paracandidimonas soli]|uniref:Uncharacterized membrane protein HdeD (DUF308 family) n=1 Tax=Paracandidimonas soli TaxID=1917182 RepID=A0A4R3VG50_9BURK|nr:DUF308 domain-containing protein [Paracandidimonas soli]TCV02669.1 uncharacterized membrane protein HdeD (DUF308 family) [Paracandidimonas soli]
MNQLPTPPTPTTGLAENLRALGARWGWFVGLGILLSLLGLAGALYVLVMTLVSVLFIGIVMLAGGISQLIHAWRVREWRSFLMWMLSGVFYTLAGLLALYDPLTGAAILTLLLGALLIAVGALRLWIWFNNRTQRGWQWLALSGIVTLLAGILIAVGWPENSLWILGLLLSFDLLFQGITLTLLGLALRRGKEG